MKSGQSNPYCLDLSHQQTKGSSGSQNKKMEAKQVPEVDLLLNNKLRKPRKGIARVEEPPQ